MTKMKNIITILFFIFCISSSNANDNMQLKKKNINSKNEMSLQKGARIFFDYCQGCHSLKYMRYFDLAKGIGIKNSKNESLEETIRNFFMHSINNISEHSPILTSISKEYGIKWFGKIPPDLSLISRYRGDDWLYTYMTTFYKDLSRPWGVNNLLFPDVGMPHILLNLQGIQILKENVNNSNELLELIEKGNLTISEYNNVIKDLVTFLSYVGEPIKMERIDLGYKVLTFLFILVILLFFLKTEYWKDVK